MSKTLSIEELHARRAMLKSQINSIKTSDLILQNDSFPHFQDVYNKHRMSLLQERINVSKQLKEHYQSKK